MEARLIFTQFPCKLPSYSPHQKNPRQIFRPRSTISPNNKSQDENINTNSEEPKESDPPSTLNIRYRVGSRRQQIKQEKQKKEEEKDGGLKKKKKWEEMGVEEKVMEVYLGEKGVLFWANKLAYASIFVVIGAWILFRFVGPYLGLYQLDSPPLSPTSIFKSS